MTSSFVEQLKAVRQKGSSGYLPLTLYWLLRKHGEAIVVLRVNGSTLTDIANTISKQFPASRSWLHIALKRLEQPAVAMAVANMNWASLEDLLFSGTYPAYKQMKRYQTYVAADNGYELYRAHLFSKARSKTPPDEQEGRGETTPTAAPTLLEPISPPPPPAPVTATAETPPKSVVASAFLASMTNSRARREAQEDAQ